MDVDPGRYIEQHCYFLGTSGSVIPDMKAVLRKVESGELDTNISLDAVSGFEGVADALAAVEARTASGKIMVYPALPDLPCSASPSWSDSPLSVAAKLDRPHGRRPPRKLLRAAGQGQDES